MLEHHPVPTLLVSAHAPHEIIQASRSARRAFGRLLVVGAPVTLLCVATDAERLAAACVAATATPALDPVDTLITLAGAEVQTRVVAGASDSRDQLIVALTPSPLCDGPVDELKAQISVLNQVIEAVPTPLHVMDAIGDHVIVANKALREIFGDAVAVTDGDGVFSLGPRWALHDKDNKLIADDDFPIRRALRGERSELELYTWVADGYETRIIECSMRPVLAADGSNRIVGGMSIVKDVTSQVAYLKQAKEKEERLTAEASALEQADKLKSDFVRSLSHELRTPVAGIIGVTDLLLETSLQPDQREYAHIIRTAGSTLLSLLGDVLDLQKISAGRLEFEDIPFDLQHLFTDLQKVALYGLKGQGTKFVADISVPKSISKVFGDPGRVKQVFSNLISNSLKFTPSGLVSITVRVKLVSSSDPLYRELGHHDPTSYADESTQSVVLEAEVRDTGVGIDSQAMKQLWKPFSQADSSTSRVWGGSGLGLSIVRQLVELMGGQVKLESEGLGKGSVATVKLMFTLAGRKDGGGAKADAGDGTLLDHAADDLKVTHVKTSSGATKRPLSSPTQNTGRDVRADHSIRVSNTISPSRTMLVPSTPNVLARPRSGYTILVADDNPIMGRITTTFLKRKGFTDNVWVQDGKEALDAVLERKQSCLARQRKLKHLRLHTPDSSHDLIDEVEDNEVDDDILENQSSHGMFDLVILDMMMPVMDGYEAARSIRQALPKVYLPLLALTAAAVRGDREKCLGAAMDDYLTKPFRSENLEERVIYYLAQVDEQRGSPPRE